MFKKGLRWNGFNAPEFTGAHTQGIENTWWGIKRGLPQTGTSKGLFDGYLQEYMWRQHYGNDPFGNIIEHIAQLCEVQKD